MPAPGFISRINKPEALKVAGFVLMVGAGFFAPVGIQIPFFIGGTAVIVGCAWSRLTA
jgi:hypothetical protein